MNRSILFCIVCMFFLVSCAPKNAAVTSTPELFIEDAEQQVYAKNTSVTSVVEKSRVTSGADVQELLWERGLEKGMEKIINLYLQDGTIFIPYVDENQSYIHPLVREELDEKPYQDTVTGDYKQDYRLDVSFIPEKTFGGVITSLGEKRTIGAFDDEVFLVFLSSEMLQEGAYFLIAEPAPFDEDNYFQVFGSGVIKQVMDSRALGMLLECKREVVPGDLIFALPVTATAMPMEQPAEETAQNTEEDKGPGEIVVEPAMEPEPLVKEPKEMK